LHTVHLEWNVISTWIQVKDPDTWFACMVFY